MDAWCFTTEPMKSSPAKRYTRPVARTAIRSTHAEIQGGLLGRGRSEFTEDRQVIDDHRGGRDISQGHGANVLSSVCKWVWRETDNSTPCDLFVRAYI